MARYSRKYGRERAAGERADVGEVGDAHLDLATQVLNPDELVASEDIYQRVHAFHETLPAGVKAEADELFGASQRELAERLGVSKSTVAQRQERLRRRIRRLAIEAGLLMPDGTYDGGAGTEHGTRRSEPC